MPLALTYDEVITVDAAELIESGLIYSADGLYSPPEYVNWFNTSTYTPELRKKQMFDTMYWKWKECTKEFIRDIKQNGFLSPVVIVWNSDDDIEVWNGNHRLAVAYNLGLPVKVMIVKHTSPWCAPSAGAMESCDIRY